jgi:hypothetical protein
MNILQQQQLWEMSRTRQAELIREARQAQVARLAPRKQQPSLWAWLAARRQRRSHFVLPQNVTPELS